MFDKTKDDNFKNKIFCFNVNVNYFILPCSNIVWNTIICKVLILWFGW